MATKLTANFTLEELCASSTARAKDIKNVPNKQETDCLRVLAENVLQPLREHFDEPIKIGSGYRCAALNKAVGGVANSQHTKGQAADLCIDGDKDKGKKWFDYIRYNLDFDQLIWEHNAKGSYWVHVSCKEHGNRHSVINNLLKR
jgi:hypothetical protein